MKDNNNSSRNDEVIAYHDKAGFNNLVVKYQSPIRRFFLHQTLGDMALSDDLAQDTFVKAYVNISKFRGESTIATWLYRIAYNVLYDYKRRQRPVANLSSDNAQYKQQNTDTSIKLDVYDALQRLGDKERTCVTLQLIDGYSIDKIAEITGIATGTVKSHLFRGKAKLTTFLRQNGYNKR